MKILDRGVYRESKICPTCQRPFSNRKKWKAIWESVIYCSEGCRKHKK
ncbi:MAG: DUF2256 domain-containing protein [Candidatus Gracilibacteria bacterium]|nr:DUF2256 domain-containing protein [Candidatus Gracilibacteria bacterium]